MNFGSGLQTHSKKTIKTLTLRKSNLLLSVTLTLIFFLFLSSLGNAENVEIRNRDTISIQQTDPPDQDEDGLSDALENMLGTNNNSKFGDKDNDGLYDFEEYLDIYGDNDTTDQTYKYDNATSVEDGLGDLYHLFGFSSNKSGYLRDQSFSQLNGGFTNYLLWNVRFVGTGAGGSISDVNYINNTMTDVSFIGDYSGGSTSVGVVSYINNTMTNINFGGLLSGGAQSGTVSYYNNTMTDVSFTGSFSGANSGDVNYTENTISDIRITKGEAVKSISGTSIYVDNVIVSDRHDSDSDGLGDGSERFEIGTDPEDSDSDNDGLNDGYEVNIKTNANSADSDDDGLGDRWEVTYNSSLHVNPLDMADDDELASDEDMDGLNLTAEFKANTNSSSNDTDGDGLNDSYEVLNLTSNPNRVDTDGDGLNDSYEVLTLKTKATRTDSDGDGLNDRWEVIYNSSSGVNATKAATDSELASDLDGDGLNLTAEAKANTNSSSNDTDSDGLVDGWEVRYSDASGVNPLVNATAEELASDLDGDGLTLLEEAQANTNSSSNDTDGDGLGDGWEVRYSDASGVNATMAATDDELASDEDSDDLNLTAEFKANTNSSSNDTDGDGLNDGYEVLNLTTDPTLNDTDGDGLNDSYEVLALMTNASSVDTDGDGLNDSYEVLTLMTNATLADTDGDGLADKWEVTYNGTPGVNPLVAATESELASDTDDDGLSLLEEFKANTDPGTADNPMSMNTTTSTTDTTGSTDSSVSSSGISAESSFAFLVVLGIFTSFSLVLVVYRVRRRIL